VEVVLSDPINGGAKWLEIHSLLEVHGTTLEIQPTTCDATQHVGTAATFDDDTVCEDNVPACDYPEWYEFSPRTPTVDRVCLEMPGCVLGDTYETFEGNYTSPRTCASVSPCKPWEYETVEESYDSDRECAAVYNCSANEFQVTAPTNTSNRFCQQADMCHPTLQTETVSFIPGHDGSRNRECEDKVHCVVGQWGDWDPCSQDCRGSGGDEGFTTRYRETEVEMEYDGTPCESDDHDTHLTETANCNTHCCAGTFQLDIFGSGEVDCSYTVASKRLTPIIEVELVDFRECAEIDGAVNQHAVCSARSGYRVCTAEEAAELPATAGTQIHCCGERVGADCGACLAGKSSDVEGTPTCTNCGEGAWSLASSTECTQCDAGKASDAEMASTESACELCGKGHWSAEGASECEACPAGTERNAEGGTNADVCMDCDPGYHAENPGTELCAECHRGSYQNEPGQDFCHECDAGYHNPDPAQSDVSACQGCGYGEWSTQGSTECAQCDAGKYQDQPLATTQSDCHSCDPGFWSAESSEQCTPCAVGHFQSSPDSASCAPCPAGRYLSAEQGDALADCQMCPNGHYCPEASENPIACDAGHFYDADEAGQPAEAESDCNQCDEGYYAPTAGLQNCGACTWGTYQDQPGADDCKDCAFGHAQPLQAQTAESACELCVAGKYQPHDHSSFCINCGSGRYQDVPAQQDCEDCPEGNFAVNAGQTSYLRISETAGCQSCLAGQYMVSPANAGAKCTDCDLGKHSTVVGATDPVSCVWCQAGQYQEELGQDHCEACGAGQYGDATLPVCTAAELEKDGDGNFVLAEAQCQGRSTHCIECPHGEYQIHDTSTACSECEAGTFTGDHNCNEDNSECTFTPNTGTVTCTPCPRVDDLRIWTSDGGAHSCYKQQMECIMNPWGSWLAPENIADNNPTDEAVDGAPNTCSRTCTDEGGWDAGTFIPASANGRQTRTRTSLMQYPCGLTNQSKCDWSWGFAGDLDDIKRCDDYEEGQDCNTNLCPRDCTLAPWAQWESCTELCGGGTTQRDRTILHPATGYTDPPGQCDHHFHEDGPCNEVSCEWPECHDSHVRCHVQDKSFTPCHTHYACGADVRSPTKCHNWMDLNLAQESDAGAEYEDQGLCHMCSSDAECALNGTHKTLVVTHDKEGMCQADGRNCDKNFASFEDAGVDNTTLLDAGREGTGVDNGIFNCSFTPGLPEGQDECSCRCKIHAACDGQEDKVLTNVLIFGNHYYGINERQLCCNMCTNHDECESFTHIEATGECMLYHGAASFSAESAPGSFSGCNSGDVCSSA
jgi:hypothetical protein